MCNNCDQIIAWPDHVWRLKVIHFAWTDDYTKSHGWAWTYDQTKSYCDSHLCKIVNTAPLNLVPALKEIPHHWILVKMLGGPKKGKTIVVAKAWLDEMITEQVRDKVYELRDKGQTLKQIAEEVGVSKSTATLYLHERAHICAQNRGLRRRAGLFTPGHVEQDVSDTKLAAPQRMDWGSSIKQYNANHDPMSVPKTVSDLPTLVAVAVATIVSLAVLLLVAL